MTVSIIVPAYKASETIARCIRSIQSQTVTDWELIIVCAPEEGNKTFNIVTGYARRDKRIIPVFEYSKTNCAIARNLGIGIASGQYVAFNDADDEWVCTKLEDQLKIDAPWVSSWFEVVPSQHTCKKSQAIQTYLLKREVINWLKKEYGYVFNPDLNAQDDLDLILRLRKQYRQSVLEKVTVFYHHSPEGITVSTGKANHIKSQWKIVMANRAYQCIPWLIKITLLTPVMSLKRRLKE